MSKMSSSAKYLYRRRRQLYDQMIRVNHSGELAADRIYWGQMLVLKNDPKHCPVIQEMWDQEKHHLSQFEKLVVKHRVSKSLFEPLWSVCGLALGATTAAMGPQAAMACTVAVEDVIAKHYDNQLRQLIDDDLEEHKQLIETIKQFRDEEQHHYDTGIEFGAQNAFAFKLMYTVISNGCRLAIKIAEKI
ncbi:unnamed protein product [Medioppia subpectinata]|uniref:5-demethoxyubiquinone hydroxylase, mitochondrial n=1 Tax=Medioppia subpectinata TaxID=1979941 RepID=A0A7R9PVY7_9ACAR|nr:unnamed protein product [Medioppia subpectinata]CAG2102755.1 unnamed protein product [Medioppia subpectinata]